MNFDHVKELRLRDRSGHYRVVYALVGRAGVPIGIEVEEDAPVAR